MTYVSELVRSATDPDPVSVSPGSLSRGEDKKPRAISLVDQYHAEHKARLKRMGGSGCFSHPGELAADLRMIVRVIPEPEAPPPVSNKLMAEAAEVAFPNWENETTKIQKAVCKQFGISRIDILSRRRTRDVVRPRQVAMYLCKKLSGRSLPEIGRRFGNRDHTTVLHAVRIVGGLLADPEFKAVVFAIAKSLGGSLDDHL